MNHNIFYLSILCCLLLACNQADAPATEVEAAEESALVSLDLLSKNERIKTGTIQKRNIARTIQCTGQINIPPTAISSIHSKTNGQLSFLKYLPGDYISKGTLLAKIESPMLVEKQRLLLETKVHLNLARKDYERKKVLKTGQATPQKVFDESQNKFELLTATYQGLKKELELFGINISDLENNTSYQPSVNIYANQSGFIHEVLVNKGQMITPETRLMDIADINHLYLELQILSKDIGAISKGQEVHFTIPNRSETFKAKIVKINPVINEGASTLQVHCHIEHPDKTIFVAGLFANARIDMAAQEVEGLPLSAVVKEGDDYFGYKIKNNEAIKTPLSNVVALNDFVLFDEKKEGQWVIEGAYYIK